MTTVPASSTAAGGTTTSSVAKLTLAAAAGATVVNLVIFVISKAFGVDYLVDDGAGGRIAVPEVVIIVATAVPMLIGALAAIVAVPRWRWARNALIGIGSFLAVVTVPAALMADASTGTRITLSVFHLVCGAFYAVALAKVPADDGAA